MSWGIYSCLMALGGSFLVHVGLGVRHRQGEAHNARRVILRRVGCTALRAGQPQPGARLAGLSRAFAAFVLLGPLGRFGLWILRLSREIRKYLLDKQDLIRGERPEARLGENIP